MFFLFPHEWFCVLLKFNVNPAAIRTCLATIIIINFFNKNDRLEISIVTIYLSMIIVIFTYRVVFFQFD
jgi:hypothetical protein